MKNSVLETLGVKEEIDENVTEGETEKDKRSGRMGRFSFPTIDITRNLDDLHEIFALLKLVPTRAESLYHSGVVDVIGFSPKFDEVFQGERLPHYEITSKKESSDGPISITVTRKEMK